jgi:predicted AlkP superfamily phosphohydrolase/phosphomutase
MISAIPTLTAAAHATLWTGVWSRTHGITGNSIVRIPRADHTLLESRSGFDSTALRAEPIWRAAARAGRRVLVLQATVGYPFTAEYPDRLLQFDVYGNRLAPIAEIAGRLQDGRSTFRIGETGFTILRGRREEELILESGDRRVTMVAGREGRFTPPMPVTVRGQDSAVRLRLFTYTPRDGRFRLMQGAVNRVNSSHPDRLDGFLRLAGAAVGEEVVEPYRVGRYGPTLGSGGTGDAEWWLADHMAANQEYFAGSLEFAETEAWDLLVVYAPNFDVAAHAWVGMIDPASQIYDEARAARVWPLLEHAFATLADGFVADVRRRWPAAALVVVSDHGHEGAGRVVLPNVALRNAGLLVLTPAGEIDLSRTQAIYMNNQGPMGFVNTRAWKGGVVAPEEVQSVTRRATRALLGMRDPDGGMPVVRAVFDAALDGAGLGIGGETGGDLYFDLAPGYYVSGDATSAYEIVSGPPPGIGFHAFAPWRRGLHAIFYAVGPGVAAGRRLGVVQAVDVAPTVAALLGVPPPAESIGRALPLN